MHAGYPDLSRDTFVDYQQRGLQHLRAFADQNSWPTVPLDPHGSVEDAVACPRPAHCVPAHPVPVRRRPPLNPGG